MASGRMVHEPSFWGAQAVGGWRLENQRGECQLSRQLICDVPVQPDVGRSWWRQDRDGSLLLRPRAYQRPVGLRCSALGSLSSSQRAKGCRRAWLDVPLPVVRTSLLMRPCVASPPRDLTDERSIPAGNPVVDPDGVMVAQGRSLWD